MNRVAGRYIQRVLLGAKFDSPPLMIAPDGDRDHWVRLLVSEGLGLLAPGGHLLVELGVEQGAAVARLCEDLGLEWQLVPDLAGVERVLQVSLRT